MTTTPGTACWPGARYARRAEGATTAGGQPVAVNYRMVQDGADWKVYDVLIDDIVPTGLISPVVRTPPRQQLTRLADRPVDRAGDHQLAVAQDVVAHGKAG